MGRWDDGTLGRFLPVVAVNGDNPAVTFPTHDYVTKSALGSACFQGTEIVARECRSQLVKDAVVGSIALAFVLGTNVLVAECLAKGLDLLTQTIFGHHQGEVKTGFRLMASPPFGGD